MLKWQQMVETKPMGLSLADERALEWTASPTYMLTGTGIVSSPSLVPLMAEKHGITCSNRDDRVIADLPTSMQMSMGR